MNTNNTGVLLANWLTPKIKVNYLEFGVLSGVNEIGADAFNAEAFLSVKQLVFTKMNNKLLRRGAFNGLLSLEVLKIMGAYYLGETDMGMLDALNATLKELIIERTDSYKWSKMNNSDIYVRDYDPKDTTELQIDNFTGSQQNLNLEYVKIRYYLYSLRKESFIALKKIKYLDLAFCGIQHIEEGAFDAVIGTVRVIRLTNNPFEKLPNGVLNLMPSRYETYIFMGRDYFDKKCECENLPVNFIAKVISCYPNNPHISESLCKSFLPTESLTHDFVTKVSPTNISIVTSSQVTVPSVLINESMTTVDVIDISPPLIIASIDSETAGTTITTLQYTTNDKKVDFPFWSKTLHLILIGTAALMMPLLLFIVWISFFRQSKIAVNK